MAEPDLNLLLTLDVLLAEGSVARAARRLRLSPSAVSRALARLREATGDPLFVRAGAQLVPTARATALRDQVGMVVEGARALLRPTEVLDLHGLRRDFRFRNRDGFVESFGAALLARIGHEAPGVRLMFLPKHDRDSGGLRNGSIDFETGVVGANLGPELHAQALFRDRFIGVVRADHPLLAEGGGISAERYAGSRHIQVSRRGLDLGPVDIALQALGLDRRIAVTVGNFSEALALARESDLIASVPDIHTRHLRDERLQGFELPFAVPRMTVSLLWHPRAAADPAHRWLKERVMEVCRE